MILQGADMMKVIIAVLMFSLSTIAFSQAPYSKTIAEWRAAAEEGEAWAQYSLGYLYDNGEGVPEDNATAVKWYTKAAEQGLAKAQFELGYMYSSGRDVPENDATAAKWFSKLAEQGYSEAQYMLASLYSEGEGVPEDNVMAYMWWNLAAAQGDEDARELKGIVQDSMTPAQIAEAQTLSRECLAKDYKNCG